MFSANCSTILWCDAMCFSQPGLRLLQGPHGWQVPGFQDSRHSGPSFPGVSRPLISAVMPSRPPPARPLCESLFLFLQIALWTDFIFYFRAGCPRKCDSLRKGTSLVPLTAPPQCCSQYSVHSRCPKLVLKKRRRRAGAPTGRTQEPRYVSWLNIQIDKRSEHTSVGS